MKFTSFTAFLLICLLAACTFFLFYPSTSFSLVNFDDPVFISHNPILFNGLSWQSFRDAFFGLHGDGHMYVPLLWVSFLLDTHFWNASDANPWGFHFSNVLFHTFNAMLLFWLLYQWGKKPWRAFFFAALWALHPLRVESVAWVTERKDVLSGFFCFLTIGAYWLAKRGDASRRASWCWTMASFALFVCGLLVKPMLVTIPFFFLLMDFWPLRRIEPAWKSSRKHLGPLIFEKLPFFLCAAIASVGVFITQTGAISPLPLWFRLYSIPPNYLFYLQKTFYPWGLYPMVDRAPVSFLHFLEASAFLLCISIWMWSKRSKFPNGWIGWCAFLGLLFPVIGIVFIGIYPVADRYSYLPSIGLSIALLGVWKSAITKGQKTLRFALAALCVLLLVLLTHRHLPTWKNDNTLYQNVEEQDPTHFAAIHFEARQELFLHGNFERANQLADTLLQQKPCLSFGLVLKMICLSQLDSAETAFSFGEEHYPPCDSISNPGVYENYLACLAFFSGEYDKADQYMQTTLKKSIFAPKYMEQLHATAMFLAYEQGATECALAHAGEIESLRDHSSLDEKDLLISYMTLWSSGLHRQILPYLVALGQTHSNRPDLLNNMAWTLATTAGSPADPDMVLDMANRALANAPQHPVILDTLAVAYANAGDYERALDVSEQILKILQDTQAKDAPSFIRSVQQRMALYQKHQPYRENASLRLVFAF
jgi:tetratricopeptide (TPR) repeat protein